MATWFSLGPQRDDFGGAAYDKDEVTGGLRANESITVYGRRRVIVPEDNQPGTLGEPFDPRPYVKDWHLHRGEERYLGFLLARAHAVGAPLPGDVILFKYGRCFSHGGIVARTDPLTIVHAFHPARVVLEEEISHNAEVAARVPQARFASYWRPDP